MRIDIKLGDTTPNACLLCQKEGQHETRYALISAISTYGHGPIMPADSLRPLDKQFYSHYDGFTIWEMHICPACMPKSRISYLKTVLSGKNSIIACNYLSSRK